MPRQLSGLDATFLYLESRETPMHVGSVNLYSLPAGHKGSFIKALRAHIASRMHLAPLFSNRLAFAPFDMGHPAWVHCEKVDLGYHIRSVKLKRGEGVEAVYKFCAEEHAKLLDRAKPLWEFVIVEGLLDRQFAFYAKIHHAALDGQGGIALANATLDVTPIPREVPAAKVKTRRTEMKIGEMVGMVFSNSLAQYAKIVKTLPSAMQSLRQAAGEDSTGTVKKLKSLTGKLGSAVQFAPRTPMNVQIGAERRFATASLPHAELRAAARALGGSLNDAVLFVCAGAMREYLKAHKALPKASLVAAMPVSLREAGNTELNNQASMTLVSLGTQYAQASKRWTAITASTGRVKSSLSSFKSLLPTDYPSFLAPWLVSSLNRAYASTASKLPPLANLVISNVPGPSVPLYLAGAKMLTYYPLSIVVHGIALNITVQSYNGRIDFGLLSCARAVPDLERISDSIMSAYNELLALAQSSTAPASSTQKASRAHNGPKKTAAKRPKSNTPVKRTA
jgi:diacylglycerol O-acyltransferase / wax synthase